MDISEYKIKEGDDIKLHKIETDKTGNFKSKEEAANKLKENIERMAKLQEKLYAQDKYSLLIIIQAMDTAGKDGAIKHVMSGLNPQSTHVHSFKQPSPEELDHDYLWRASKNLPERGQIGIFNRSYYEEVLIVRVHNLILKQQLPVEVVTDSIWKDRYRQIRDYERYLSENGTVILKFFLHISKEEQKERLLSRINDPAKNWKFSEGDLVERGFWDEYQKCYEEAIRETSTKNAPWYVVPADKKWFARLTISEIIAQTMENMKIEFPSVSQEQLKVLELCKQKLLNE